MADPQPRDSFPLAASRRLLPGLALCAGVTLLAAALAEIEAWAAGRAWLEPLVLAILIGAAVRTAWTPPPSYGPGISFAAKGLLEVAVMLLGASISAQAVLSAGGGLVLGIATVVAVAVPVSYGIGRLLGLPWRMAVLVACGNSICGNSAIAAVAPVIGATAKDVAASIAFTAVFGVGVVLALPLLVPVLHLSELQFGVLAGLTVYAVPQVLAATAPVGTLAVQMGTLVKLVRVLMLGPIVVALSVAVGWQGPDRGTARARPPLSRMVPWFILGFLGLAALRSVGVIPSAAAAPITWLTSVLTVVAMAALGLGVDVRSVARAGLGVTLSVVVSLLLLAGISLALIRLLGVA